MLVEPILMVHHESRLGGAELSMLELAERFPDKSRLACVIPPGPLADKLHIAGVRVIHAPLQALRKTLDPLKLLRQLNSMFLQARSLRDIFRREGAGFVHANSFTSALAVNAAAKKLKIPFSWHERDLAPHPVLAPRLARAAKFAVCISEAVARNLRNQLPESLHSKLRVVPNGVDLEKFRRLKPRPDWPGIPGSKKTVLIASQFVPWKGHLDFIRTAALVKSRMPDTFFIVAGDAGRKEQQGYIGEIRASILSKGLEGDFAWPGEVGDMRALLSASDCLVLPSCNEPFGRIAAEAMAAGTPVVAYGSGAMPELIENGVSGMLVATGDYDAAAECVCKILSDVVFSSEIARRGRMRAEMKFDIESTAAGFLRLLGEHSVL